MHGVTSEVGDARVGSGLRGAMCGQLSLAFDTLVATYCGIIV